jgi:hypothetical protein
MHLQKTGGLGRPEEVELFSRWAKSRSLECKSNALLAYILNEGMAKLETENWKRTVGRSGKLWAGRMDVPQKAGKMAG